jgi:hypothetical protein
MTPAKRLTPANRRTTASPRRPVDCLFVAVKRNRIRYNPTVIALLLLTSSLGHAQKATPPEREAIQQLIQQVKELQDKVKVLQPQQGSRANLVAGPPRCCRGDADGNVMPIS